MKKIIRNIFLCFLAIVVVGAGCGYYFLFHDPNGGDIPVAKPTVTDANGSTYLAVLDEQGTTYAVVTDADGNRYAAEFNGSQVGATVGQINDQIKLEDVPQNQQQNGPAFEVTADPNIAQGDVSHVAPQQNTTAPQKQEETTKAPSQQQTPPQQDVTDPNAMTAYRIEKYLNIFKSGNYLMQISTNDPDLAGPITMATKNGNMYVETGLKFDENSEPFDIKMIYRNDNQTMYLLFDSVKKYSKIPEDMMGEDMNFGSMMSEFGSIELGEVTVSEVEINGQRLILESYISPADGATNNYYFDGDILVRKDAVYSNGKTDSTYFTKITTDVPDSYFEIPSGYSYLNISWLAALMNK